MNIGLRLKSYAKEKHGGVVKLADKLGMSQPQLSNYIGEKIKPGYEILIKLASLNCNLNWLLLGDEVTNVVKEPAVPYNPTVEERLAKLEAEVEKLKARNYDLNEENIAYKEKTERLNEENLELKKELKRLRVLLDKDIDNTEAKRMD